MLLCICDGILVLSSDAPLPAIQVEGKMCCIQLSHLPFSNSNDSGRNTRQRRRQDPNHVSTEGMLPGRHGSGPVILGLGSQGECFSVSGTSSAESIVLVCCTVRLLILYTFALQHLRSFFAFCVGTKYATYSVGRVSKRTSVPPLFVVPLAVLLQARAIIVILAAGEGFRLVTIGVVGLVLVPFVHRYLCAERDNENHRAALRHGL